MQIPETITRTKWIIDPANSHIGFGVKCFMFTTVRGHFKKYDTNIYTTEDDFSSAEIDFWLDPESVDTGNEQKDAHLKSADFFDVKVYKEIRFTSNILVEFVKDKQFMLYGELSIKGISRQIRLEIETGGRMKDPWGTERVLFNITGKINRRNWGLNWNAILEAGGVLISDDVWINCEVHLIKAS
jgi:polyisoprenoid-binding protein YceI